MKCLHCETPIPPREQGVLLGAPLEDMMLLLCGTCDRVTILAGGELLPCSKEYISKMSPDEVQSFVEAVVAMRALKFGPEGALELYERYANEAREGRL